MSVNDQYALNWSNHTSHIRKAFDTLLSENQFVDVTLSCEGKKVVAHKIILSACSTYFHDLFRDNPCQHPIVILKDVKFQNLIDILKFIYNGEVSVSSDNFDSFLKTAELLQISGLTDDDSKQLDEASSAIESNETPSLETTSINLKSTPQPSQSTSTSITHQVKSPPVTKKRPMEVPQSEEPATILKKKRESSSGLDIEIKEEISESNFEDDELNSIIDIKDPLQLEQQQEEPDLSESLPIDTEECSTSVSSSLVPEKSRLRYELTYERFVKWCEDQEIKVANGLTEDVLMTYFEQLAKTQKPPTLWANYSMLRSVILVKKTVDISNYKLLLTFLKRKSRGYQAKKSKILTKQDVTKFLKEADDYSFLLTKVTLIIGLRGACKRDDLTNLMIENVHDEGQVFRFVIPNTNRNPREFFVTAGDIHGLNMVDIIRKYIALRPKNTCHNRFFVGYRNTKCTTQPVGVNTFGSMAKVIASFLKLPNPENYTGHCFRRSSTSLLLNTGASFASSTCTSD